MTTPNYESPVQMGNRAFQEGRYAEAIALYETAIEAVPVLRQSLAINIDLARQRISHVATRNNKKTLGLPLEPVSQITQDAKKPGHWHATGYDPYFEARLDKDKNLSGGWYQIHFLINTEVHRRNAKIYLDYGHGYSEANAVNCPYQSNQIGSRIVYVTHGVDKLRFDPMEAPGAFQLSLFRYEPLDEADALEKMLTLILKKEKTAENKGTAQLRQVFQENATRSNTLLIDKVFSAYGESFAYSPGAASYADWIELLEKPTLPLKEQIPALLDALGYKPLISVVMPTYNTDSVFLRACIDSVLDQSYPHWELCIADDASPMPHVREILSEYQAKDARIKLCFREQNGHISRASNSALALATGEFVALLDHDDELAQHALMFVVQAINLTPDAQVLYSDEDKLNKNGERCDVHFKSDWNPDLFFSQNYVSHLGVYRHTLLQRIGGFRPGLEGSQDQDLLLRCLPHINGQQIVHIPKVLYHWRSVEGSTALGANEKGYTTQAGVKALTDYFASNGPNGVKVDVGLVPNTYRITWPIPQPAPMVSLLIPTRDRKEITEVAVRSILDKTTYPNFEILILDNGSIEPQTLHWFDTIQRQDTRVKVLRYDHPFNYSAINNFGAKHASGSILGLVNNDIEVISPDWLTEMVGHANRADVGCVGAKLYYENDSVQHGGVIIGLGGVAGHSHKHAHRSSTGYFHRLVLTQALSAVTAACLLIRKTIYREVLGLDEKNLAVAFNDIDFCLKVMQAGYRNIWTPHAELYHYESISRGAEDTPEKRGRFQKEVMYMKEKWGNTLERDPFYSPNLTLDREDFSII